MNANERLNEIAERLAAATPGPWVHEPWGGQNQNGDYSGGSIYGTDGECIASDVSDTDGDLIANAPADLADAVAALYLVLTQCRLAISRARYASDNKEYSAGLSNLADDILSDIEKNLGRS